MNGAPFSLNCREECSYSTKLVEKCTTEKQRVCEKFWKDDGYGGKVWTEDVRKCHYLEADECMNEPQPVKVRRTHTLNSRESSNGTNMASRKIVKQVQEG